MNDVTNISTLNDLNEFLKEDWKLEGYNWKGDRLYSHGQQILSGNSLIKTVDQAYHRECFKGAILSMDDKLVLKSLCEKIKDLNQQSIELSTLQSFYLKIAAIITKIFQYLSTGLWPEVLLKEISTRSSDLDELGLLKNAVNKTTLDPQVEDALCYSYDNYYSQPYKDSNVRKKEAVRIVQGTEIHRYNHGLAHTVRKAFFIPFIINYLMRHGKAHLQTKLIQEQEPNKLLQKLQIAITFEVAGRQSECGSRDNLGLYTSYLEASSEAFKGYCKEKGLIGEDKLFKDNDEVERYGNAIKEKYYNRFLKEEMDVVAVVLDMAHTFDEFRCYWPSRMEDELETINHYYTQNKNNRDLWELSKFFQKAVKVTGDRLMTEFSESFSQRNTKFAISNFTSIVSRNFNFTNGKTFLKCSNNVAYCWNLLSRLAPPISYSSGETTFSYLNNSISHIAQPNANDALELISQGRGAIRLVNTQAEKFGFEMTMLNDPVYFRPTRHVKKDVERDFVLDSRTEGKILHRKFKEKRATLEEQIQASNREKLPSQPKKWKPVHQDKDRGLPKFTEYTKKLSFSLLRPDGKTNHFTGEFPKEFGSYKPVGFLYDVDALDQRKQKYIFDLDVGTTSKFWLGKKATDNLNEKEGRASDLTLAELQALHRERVNKREDVQKMPFYKMQHASNEILMSPKKSGIRAVFATEDQPLARLRTLMHAVYLDHDYGIKVPTLIVDGTNPPKAYTLQDLQEDLELLKSSEAFTELASCFFSKKEIEEFTPTHLLQELKSHLHRYLI